MREGEGERERESEREREGERESLMKSQQLGLFSPLDKVQGCLRILDSTLSKLKAIFKVLDNVR